MRVGSFLLWMSAISLAYVAKCEKYNLKVVENHQDSDTQDVSTYEIDLNQINSTTYHTISCFLKQKKRLFTKENLEKIRIVPLKDIEENVESSTLPENTVAISIKDDASTHSSADNKATYEDNVTESFLPTAQSEDVTTDEYEPLSAEVIDKLLRIDKEIKITRTAFYAFLVFLVVSVAVCLYIANRFHDTILFEAFLFFASVFATIFLVFAIGGPKWLDID